MLARREATGAAQSRLYFVANQQCSMGRTEILCRAKVSSRRHAHAPFALQRLDQEGGRIAGGQCPLELREVAEGHRSRAGQERLEWLAIVGAVGDGQSPQTASVKGALARDDSWPA